MQCNEFKIQQGQQSTIKCDILTTTLDPKNFGLKNFGLNTFGDNNFGGILPNFGVNFGEIAKHFGENYFFGENQKFSFSNVGRMIIMQILDKTAKMQIGSISISYLS